MPELRHQLDASQAGRVRRRNGELRAAAGVPLLRLSADRSEEMPQVRQRTFVLPGRGFAAGRGAAAGDLSLSADWPHGPRYRARTLRYGTAAGAAAFGRNQPVGWNADD